MVLSEVLSHCAVLPAAGVQSVELDVCARGAAREVAHSALSNRLVYMVIEVLVSERGKVLRVQFYGRDVQ